MIKLIVDMAADIPKKIAEDNNITVLPFYINFGNESIKADSSYTPQEFYAKLKTTDAIPTTSQTSPEDLKDVYEKLSADGSSVIHITISSNGSGVVNTAKMLADELNANGADITIVDSQTYSIAIGYPALEAANMIKNGASKETVVSFLENRYKNDKVYFMVDDLTFLKNGGRIKATTMVISSILDIKPILMSNDGLVEAFAKVKGSKRAVSKLIDIAVEKMDDPQNNTLVLLQSETPDKIELAKKLAEEKLHPKDIEVFDIGPVITAHAGTGVLGMYFKHKEG